MRCARHALPDLDWSQVEEAQGRRDFEIPIEGEILDIGVIEADIANADPRCEFEEEQGQNAANTAAAIEKQKDPVVVIDGLEEEEPEE